MPIPAPLRSRREGEASRPGEGLVTQIKICGISTPDAYEAAARADYVGFVFFPPSPRYVTPAGARLLAVSPVAHVGLFVNPADAHIEAALEAIDLDVLQLVATSPSRAAAIRRTFGRPVWRAIGIQTGADLPVALEGADAVLLDAKPPAGASRPGGNAASFDWSVLSGWDAPGPWVLAGGLTPGNVAAAIAATAAPAVDVSSGVERAPGVKDPAMIAAFLQAARTVE